MRFSANVNTDASGIVELANLVQDHLEKYGVKKQGCMDTALVVEEGYRFEPFSETI